MKKWNHKYAEVNGIHLHYVKEGEGDELIVFLHGWPEFWYTWRNQLKALKGNYTVVAPDMRGFNLSEKPKGAKEYTQSKVAKDIVALIEHLGYEKAIIVGHDWGGAIAWHLALNYPDLVAKFVVINCPHPGIFIRHLKSNFDQVLRSWYMFFFLVPVIPELLIGWDLRKFFIKILRDWSLNKEHFTDEVIEEYAKAYRQKDAITSSINYYKAGMSIALGGGGERKNRKVKAPTLMIWGNGDKMLGEELTEGTGEYIDADFTLHVIQNCSHWVQSDCPDEVNAVLKDFLG